MTTDTDAEIVSRSAPAFDLLGRTLRRYAIFIILAALIVFFHSATTATDCGTLNRLLTRRNAGTADIQEIREPGSSWAATSATNQAIVGEVSLRALVLLIAGQDPGKVVEVKPVFITHEALEKNDVKTVQDLDKKLPGFGVSDLATASWLTAPAEKTQQPASSVGAAVSPRRAGGRSSASLDNGGGV